MTFKQISIRLHKWLGLFSGGVVCVVCLTGALYAFKEEIEAVSEPWRFVSAAPLPSTSSALPPARPAPSPSLHLGPHLPAPPTSRPVLPPSEIFKQIEPLPEAWRPYALTYGEATDAVRVDLTAPEGKQGIVWIDPYEGTVLKRIEKEAGDFDFFRFVLDGHRRLWLPPAIGKPLVGSCVLVFLVVLLSGCVIWWPKVWTRERLRRLFRIKCDGGTRRLLFDAHMVVGVYAVVVLVGLAATGLVWSFDWYSRGVYRLTGGKELKAYKLPVSDTTAMERSDARGTAFPLDKLYHRLREEEPVATGFYFVMPQRPEDVCRVSIVHKRNSYYRTDNRFFDRYSLEELSGEGPYAGRYQAAPLPDRLRRMNLEWHDGRIAGWPGKLVVCLAALAGASLPVSGYWIWWKKRKGKRKQPERPEREKACHLTASEAIGRGPSAYLKKTQNNNKSDAFRDPGGYFFK